MGSKKNIDRLFQEQFENFEVSPDEAIWENIESRLEEDRKRRGKFPLWMKLGGIAASLVLLVAVSVALFVTDDIRDEVVDVSEDEKSVIKNVSNAKENASEIIGNNVTDTPVLYSKNSDLQNQLFEEESNSFKNKELENPFTVGSNEINSDNINVVNNTHFPVVYLKNSDLQNQSLEEKSNSFINKELENPFAVGSNASNSDNIKVVNNTHLNRGAHVKGSGFVSDDKAKVGVNEVSFNKDLNLSRNASVIQNETLLKSENKLPRLNNSDEEAVKNIGRIANNNEAGFENDQLSSLNTADKVFGKKVKDGVLGENDKQDGLANSGMNNTIVSADKNNENTSYVTGKISGEDTVENDASNIDPKNMITSVESELVNEEGNEEEDLCEEEDSVKKTIEEAIVKQKVEEGKNEKNPEEDIAFNNWRIAPNIAAVYYNTLSGGSPIDSELAANKKKGQLTMSYGLGVGYVVNNRITIRTGLNKVELGYDTQDVAINSSPETSGGPRIKNINLAPGAASLNIASSDSFLIAQIPSSFSSLFNSSLNQRLGYLEVPLELSYKVSDKKIKLDVIAGISTFFLNKNEIYSETNGKSIFIGEANNLNKMSYSTNIGLGLNYKIAKAFNFNFEPMFKYQLNAFSNDSGDFKPYILGVYSGFSYKF